VRNDLVEVRPYFSPQRRAQFRMNTNESPYPPPQPVIDAIAAAARDIALNRYPDRDARTLFGLLAGRMEWSRDGLWIANGSNEVLLHLFLAYGGPGRTVLTFEPTYSLHTLIPRTAGTHIRNLWRDEDFAIDLDDALEQIDDDQTVIVACEDGEESAEVADELRERGIDAVSLEGGMEAWRSDDMPMQPSRDPEDGAVI
jgi:histidinol-phosphate aminotransferase